MKAWYNKHLHIHHEIWQALIFCILFSISSLRFNTWKFHWRKPYEEAYSDPLNDLPIISFLWISAEGKFKPFAFALSSFIHSFTHDIQLRNLALISSSMPWYLKLSLFQPPRSRPSPLPFNLPFQFRLMKFVTTMFFTMILPMSHNSTQQNSPHGKLGQVWTWNLKIHCP